MVWGQISFILGVVGNIFILYSTTVHNAIKLDKMSIWIIKNLAVADICNCFLVVFPILLNQYGKLNGLIIFGETFNNVMGCYRYLFFVANLYQVNILSLNKLLRCLFPLRNMVPTKRQKLIVTMTTIFISALPMLFAVYSLKSGLTSISPFWEDQEYLGGAWIAFNVPNPSSSKNRHYTVVNLMVVCVFNALPCLTLVVINSSLVIFALLKASYTVNKMNILIVILVTIAFLISFLPFFMYNILLIIPSLQAIELTWSATYISVWINPIIYLAVNPSFKRFTAEKLSPLKKFLTSHGRNLRLLLKVGSQQPTPTSPQPTPTSQLPTLTSEQPVLCSFVTCRFLALSFTLGFYTQLHRSACPCCAVYKLLYTVYIVQYGGRCVRYLCC